MPLNDNPKPFGLSDVKLTSIDGTTQADLPASTKLTFKERVKSAEGPGDDMLSVVVAVRDAVEWELEATGLPLEALAVMYGTTTGTTGSTPNQVKTLSQAGGVRLPYFKIYGKSLGEGDDDVHCITTIRGFMLRTIFNASITIFISDIPVDIIIGLPFFAVCSNRG